MASRKTWKTLAILALGASPLATVSTCDYGPGGGYFFLDRGVEAFGTSGYVEEVYYDDGCCGGYYEEVIYYDEYYDDDDDE